VAQAEDLICHHVLNKKARGTEGEAVATPNSKTLMHHIGTVPVVANFFRERLFRPHEVGVIAAYSGQLSDNYCLQTRT